MQSSPQINALIKSAKGPESSTTSIIRAKVHPHVCCWRPALVNIDDAVDGPEGRGSEALIAFRPRTWCLPRLGKWPGMDRCRVHAQFVRSAPNKLPLFRTCRSSCSPATCERSRRCSKRLRLGVPRVSWLQAGLPAPPSSPAIRVGGSRSHAPWFRRGDYYYGPGAAPRLAAYKTGRRTATIWGLDSGGRHARATRRNFH